MKLRDTWEPAVRRLRTVIMTAVMLIIGFGGAAAAKPRGVSTKFPFPPGTIIIVNNERKLYYITADRRTLRYPVAVGKRSELWVGRTFVSAKRVNPYWTPVDGGPTVRGGRPDNPLGKRAIYLDWSLLRIHGTPSRGSVGRAVSDGCIRMLNEDVIDLYKRVHLGAPVIAVNKRSEVSRFAARKVTGKQPARGRVAAR